MQCGIIKGMHFVCWYVHRIISQKSDGTVILYILCISNAGEGLLYLDILCL